MFIVGIILLLTVTVFVLENRAPITVEFLAWRYNTQLGLALVAAAVLGAIVIYISGLLKQRELRSQVRAAETRSRDAEARYRELERQQQAGEDEGETARA